jgi:hypothetical protein
MPALLRDATEGFFVSSVSHHNLKEEKMAKALSKLRIAGPDDPIYSEGVTIFSVRKTSRGQKGDEKSPIGEGRNASQTPKIDQNLTDDQETGPKE